MNTLQGCFLCENYFNWYTMPKLDGNRITRYIDKVEINKPTLELSPSDWWDTTMTVKDLLNLIKKRTDGNIIIRVAGLRGDIASVRKQSIIIKDFYDRKKEWIEEALVIVHV